jgi:hypothetical protein
MGKKPTGFSDVQKRAGPSKDVNRGTQDELEILGQIVAQSPMLRQGVLDKLRQAKERFARQQGSKVAATDSKDDKKNAG